MFLMSSKHVLNVNMYLDVKFLATVCLIAYVLRWFQVRVLILHFSFMNHFSIFRFNQLQYLYSFMSSDHVLYVIQNFFNVTFLTSIIEFTYVPRWFRTDDRWIIFCCQLTPTLYHCATEDNGQELLFVYLYLNSL